MRGLCVGFPTVVRIVAENFVEKRYRWFNCIPHRARILRMRRLMKFNVWYMAMRLFMIHSQDTLTLGRARPRLVRSTRTYKKAPTCLVPRQIECLRDLFADSIERVPEIVEVRQLFRWQRVNKHKPEGEPDVPR